jgi:hypothetical protein
MPQHSAWRASRGLLLAAALLIFGGCSGGGSSPTEPGGPAPGGGATGSATINGQVASAGGSSTGGAAAVGGITVRIEGTSLAATTGSDGRFALAGVPEGDRVLVFETAAQRASLPISRVRPNERIEMTVSIRAATVSVMSMSRSSGGTSLSLEMQPDTWNTNWAGSSGTVSALIRGEGFETIDLDSIELIGTDPAAVPLAAERADLAGNHVRAFFGKSEAIQTLDTPTRNEVHTITIRLTADGEELELTADVRIVGPPS